MHAPWEIQPGEGGKVKRKLLKITKLSFSFWSDMDGAVSQSRCPHNPAHAPVITEPAVGYYYLDILGVVYGEVGHHQGVLEVLGVVGCPVAAQTVVVLQ